MTIGNHLAEWLSRLVQIPSVSPDQAGPWAGAPGEARLAAEVSHWFRKFGGEVYQEDVLPDRPNIYGLWQGRSDRWMGVDVHMDTVGVEQMVGDPFDGRIDGDRVYGRGAVDTKATLAVVLALLEVMANTGQKPRANLIVVATIDEEVNARGAPAFANWIRERQLPLDQLAVAEPTQCGPVYGHKGVCRVELQVKGKSTHSAQPELGENAITAAAEVVQALAAENERLQALPQETAMGSPTLTVSLIQGGTGINVVPDLCQLTLDRRTIAGEKTQEVAQALHQLAREACPLPVTMESLLQLDAFYQSPETPWLKQLAEWSGREPAVVPYATNAWAYADLARECAVIGPGSIDQAHGDEEWVEISELEKLADIYAKWWEIRK